MPDKLHYNDFAAKIKAKYPDYKDIDNLELAQKMVKKYPDYKEQVDFTEKKKSGDGYTPSVLLTPNGGETGVDSFGTENAITAAGQTPKEFERRIQNPIQHILNDDGSISTHKMASSEVDGKQIAYPTIVNINGKLKELSGEEAFNYAMKTGEFKEFKTAKEAQDYAEGGYKKGTPLENYTGKPVPPKTATLNTNKTDKTAVDVIDQTKVDYSKARNQGYADSISEIVANAVARGNAQGEEANLLTVTGDQSPDDIKRLANIERRKQFYPTSESYAAFNNAKTFSDALGALASDPVKIIAELSLESLTALARHGSARIGAGAATGAAAGSVVPGVGTASGAATGAVVGLGLSSLNLEYSGSILESLGENGIDVSDPESLKKGFEDEEKFAEIRKTALQKGVPVALFDMLSAGLAGRIASKPAKTLIKKVAQIGAEAGVQAGLGGAGEVAGELTAGQKINPAAILGEMVGELGGGAPEIITGTMFHKAKEGTLESGDVVKAVVANPGNPGKIIDQIDVSENSGELPEDVSQALKAAVTKVAEIDSKVPPEIVEPEKRQQSIELIMTRNGIDDAIKVKTEELQNVDEAFRPIREKEIATLTKERDNVNKEILGLSEVTKDEAKPKAVKVEPVPEEGAKEADIHNEPATPDAGNKSPEVQETGTVQDEGDKPYWQQYSIFKDGVTEGKEITSENFLKEIVANPASESINEAAQVLLRNIKKNNIKIKGVPQNTGASGLYDHKNKEIKLTPFGISFNNKEGFERMITHELTHAFTVSALEDGIKGLDKRNFEPDYKFELNKDADKANLEFSKKMLDAYEQSKELLLKKYEKDIIISGGKISSRSFKNSGAFYGLTNPAEFVAEIFTNKRFQDIIRGEKTVWQKVVGAIRDFLGFTNEQNTIVEDTVKAITEHIDGPKTPVSETKKPDSENKVDIKPSDIGDNVDPELIPKNDSFKDVDLTDQQKNKLTEKEVFPIQHKFIPKEVYRGITSNGKSSQLKTAINQIETFRKYIEGSAKKTKIDELLRSAGLSSKKDPEGIMFNWYGVNMFTTPNKVAAEKYTNGVYEKEDGGYFSKFKINKENPVIITKSDAKKLLGKQPVTVEDILEADKIMAEYGIDGIMYESDGNAIAWINPEKNLTLTEVYGRRYGKDKDGDTEIQDIPLYTKEPVNSQEKGESNNGKTKDEQALETEADLLTEKTPAGGENLTGTLEKEPPAVEKKVQANNTIVKSIPEHKSREKSTVNVSEQVSADIENIELPDGDEGYRVTVNDSDDKEIDSQDFYEKDEVVKFLTSKQKGYELSKKPKKETIKIGEVKIEIGDEISFMDNAGAIVKGKIESIKGEEVKIKNEKGVIYTRSKEDLQRAQVNAGLSEAKAKIDKAVTPPKPNVAKDVKDISEASIIPVKKMIQETFKGANALQDKTAKYVDQAETWLSAKIKQVNVSNEKAARVISQAMTSYANGLPRNSKELTNKMLLKGGIKMAQVNMVRNIDALRQLIDNDLTSMEKVHEVLDPEFYKDVPNKTVATFDDLNDTEKQLYTTLRAMLDYVHDYNFAMGMLDAETYNKYKGTYTPRMYETFEVPEDVQKALDDHNAYASNKLNTSIFKQRKEVTAEMMQTILKDPIYATTKRMMQTEVNASILSYLEQVNQDPLLVSDVEKKGFAKLDGKGYGPLNGKYVVNYIAEDLKGFFFARKEFDFMYNAFKVYDKFTLRQLVKKYHTVWQPGVQLGNFTSNFVFAFMGGLDPITYASNLSKAAKEIKNQGETYDLLVKNGIIGSDVLSSDLLPLTPAIQAAQAQQPTILKKMLGKVDDFAMKLYEGTDNNAKVAAYMGFREYGYSEQEAIKRVYESFQNYATVGKLWDAASKTPVFGNAYVKFQADLQRILKNAALKRPLTTAMYAGMIYAIGQLASGLSDEDDKHKELREGREFIPKVDLGLAQIPLTFKTPAGEVNLARYLSPYYIYDVGDAASPIESWSKLLPYKVKYEEGPAKGVLPWLPSPTSDDPLAGVWFAALISDRDFRGKSIKDPLSTRYRTSGLTTTEKAMNSINYVLRSQLPYYDLAEDMYMATTGGTDFYGRQKNGWQALISQVVKVQEFGPVQYNQVVERKLTGFKYKIEGLEQEVKDIDATIVKVMNDKSKLLQNKVIDKAQFDKIVVEQLDNRAVRKAVILQKMADVQKDFNTYVDKYKDFIPNNSKK